jgi:hypothetical protein
MIALVTDREAAGRLDEAVALLDLEGSAALASPSFDVLA